MNVFIQVRTDHTTRTLSFGSDLNYSTKEDSPVGPFLQKMPSEQIRNQLTAMSASLAKAIQVIKPSSILVSSRCPSLWSLLFSIFLMNDVYKPDVADK